MKCSIFSPAIKITTGALGGNSFDLVQSIATNYFAELALSFRTNMAIISSSVNIYFSLQHFLLVSME